MAAPKLYLDEHVSVVIAHILRSRKLDVMTTQEADNIGRSDPEQLEYASEAGRCLVSYNAKDFVPIHSRFMRDGLSHGGIVLVPHDPRPSVVASKLLKRLAKETDGSVQSSLLFA